MLQPAPVQSTYAQYLTAAQLGMPASTSGWDVDTKICEDTSGLGIGFGLAVSQGTLHGDRSACLGLFSGGKFVGITAADPTLPNISAGFTDRYADTDNMAVAVRGDWWVLAAAAVVAGDPVYFNAGTGVLGNASLPGGTVLEDARWMTSAAIGKLAVVRLGSAAGGQ